MTEGVDIKKLYYQGTHRGMREVDVILASLMEQLSIFPKDDLLVVEAFLKENDQDILGWVMGTLPTPESYGFIMKTLTQSQYRIAR